MTSLLFEVTFLKMKKVNCSSCPNLASLPRNCEVYCMICSEDRRLRCSVNICFYFFASMFCLYENKHIFIILNGLSCVLTKFLFQSFTVVAQDFDLYLPKWICSFAEEKNRSMCGFYTFIILQNLFVSFCYLGEISSNKL